MRDSLTHPDTGGARPPKLASALGALASIVCAVSLLYLGCASLVVTGVLDVTRGTIDTEHMTLSSLWSGDPISTVLLPLLAACALLACIFFAWRLLPRLGMWGYAAIVIVVSLAAQIGWIVLLGLRTPYPYADTLNLDQLARAYLAGDPSAFPTEVVGGAIPYLLMYPFQSGGVLLFSLFIRVFGDGYQVALMLANALFNTVALVSALSICDSLGRSEDAVRCCALLECLFLPVFFSAAFVYCNSIGIGFAALALALNIRAMASGGRMRDRAVMVACSLPCMVFVLWFKSTFLLILLAIAVAWVVYALGGRRRIAAVVPVAAVLVLNQLGGLPTSYLEHRLGKDFGDGMPKVSWIAMGMRGDSVADMPGWWSFFPSDLYKRADGDGGRQSELAIESIEDSAARFAGDPSYALSFFGAKLASEWLDPTYATLYYSALADNAPVETVFHHIMYFGGTVNAAARTFMDGFQSVLYLFAAVGCAALFRRVRSSTNGMLSGAIALCATFVFGFGCYVFWEAKSIYLLPFAMLLVPFAAIGTAAGFRRLRALAAGGGSREVFPGDQMPR